MAQRIRVVNTAPLIFLAKLGQLPLLRMAVGQVYVPPTVLAELRAVPDEATRTVEAFLWDWLIERACSNLPLLAITTQIVDPGEAEVIALALELATEDVVLDDLEARRFARRCGLQPIGTLGLLVAAKQAGRVEAVAPEIERLKEFGFRASKALVGHILAEVGEKPLDK
jgi:predicted nucleic acid-binding protein